MIGFVFSSQDLQTADILDVEELMKILNSSVQYTVGNHVEVYTASSY